MSGQTEIRSGPLNSGERQGTYRLPRSEVGTTPSTKQVDIETLTRMSMAAAGAELDVIDTPQVQQANLRRAAEIQRNRSSEMLEDANAIGHDIELFRSLHGEDKLMYVPLNQDFLDDSRTNRAEHSFVQRTPKV